MFIEMGMETGEIKRIQKRVKMKEMGRSLSGQVRGEEKGGPFGDI